MGVPIYFVALITRDNRPLHIQKFSPYERSSVSESTLEADYKVTEDETPTTESNKNSDSYIDERNANELLKYNFLSNMALDVFTSTLHEPSSIDQNCSLLFVQDGVSVYGYETNTGLKIVIGTATSGEKYGKQLDGIFKNIHKAYLRLICNPFQPLDENSLISSKRLEKSIIEVVDVWNSQQ